MTSFISSVFALVFACPAWAAQIPALVEFHRDPLKAMNHLPAEIAGAREIDRGPIDFDALNDVTFSEKMKLREQIMGRGRDDFRYTANMGEKDQPQTLVDNEELVTNIYDMHKRGLMRAALDVAPWADSYWPTYKGIIAIRYADKGFPNAKEWLPNYSYFLNNPALSIFNSGDRNRINRLSPAEKYDLLVGDSSLTLTKYAWAAGKKYFDKYGYVEKWMGICHGWAAASHMLAANITSPVTVYSPRGTPITFYQSDVKALNSMLWANASPLTRFVGNRCKTPRPAKNEIGRILDDGCWDTNPGTFHLALTNQVGLNKRSFVIDTTYDAEVWNFAIVSYRMQYFNPQTLRPTPVPREAILPMNKYSLDKFKEFRSPDAKFVIGVVLDLTHVNAVNPAHSTMTKDITKTLRYFYDLELDAKGNVIGGEWYTSAHPDFIWTFAPGSQARARADLEIDPREWMTSGPVPSHWTSAAQRASAAGIPLYSVIKRIVGQPEVRPPLSAGTEMGELPQ